MLRLNYFEINCLLNALDKEIDATVLQERFELEQDGILSDGGDYKRALFDIQAILKNERNKLA